MCAIEPSIRQGQAIYRNKPLSYDKTGFSFLTALKSDILFIPLPIDGGTFYDKNLSSMSRAVMSNLASKLGQIGPKWDKSETF